MEKHGWCYSINQWYRRECSHTRPALCIAEINIGLSTCGVRSSINEILLLFLWPPPKHKPAVAERSNVNHCLKFSQLNQGRLNVISMLFLEFIPSLDTAKPTQLGLTHLHGFIKYFWKACVLPLECSGLHQEYVMLQHGGRGHPWLFLQRYSQSALCSINCMLNLFLTT